MAALGLLVVKVNQVTRYVCDVPYGNKNLTDTQYNYSVIIVVYPVNRVLMVILEMQETVVQRELLERRY